MDPRAVADWPWHEVLIWEAALGEVERVRGLQRTERMLHAASLTGMAFHEPKALAGERQKLRGAQRLPAAMAPEEVAGHIDALVAQIALAERIARRKRRRGGVGDLLSEVRRGD